MLPSTDELRAFYQAATIGDIQYITTRLEQFVVQDADLRPFAEEINVLVQTFQIDRLCQELKRLLDYAESDKSM